MEEAAAQAQVRRQVGVAGGQPDDEAEAAWKPPRVLPHRVGPNDDGGAGERAREGAEANRARREEG